MRRLASFAVLSLSLALLALPARANTPRVVADIGPVASLVAMVMQGAEPPAQLVPAGASPHSFALRPSDARALSRADLVVWVGPALEPALSKTIAQLAGGARVITLDDLPETLHLPARTGETFIGGQNHQASAGAPDKGAALDQPADKQGHDPHIWLSPHNAEAWLGVIAEELATLDPQHAAAYRANAAEGAARIEAARTQAAALLAPVADRPFIVFHDAFQYFEHAFGLRPIGAISLSDATPPSPARLAALRQAVAEQHVTCAVAEPEYNPGLVAAIAPEGGLHVEPLDPLGAVLGAGPEAYPALIETLAEGFARCLSTN